MKYVHRDPKNGKVMEILKEDKARGTLQIKFEDGKVTTITTGTFKRWYKKLEDNVATEIETPVNEPDKTVVDGVTDEASIQEVMQQKKELGIECPPITEVEVVSQEEEQPKKVRKPKTEKQTKAPKQDIEASAAMLINFVEERGFTTHRVPNAPKCITVGFQGKNSYDIYLGGTKFSFDMPASKVPEGYVADRVRNCPRSHAFDMRYDNLDKLAEMLKSIKAKEEK